MLETLASFWLTEHLFGATWRPERGAMGYDRIINKFRHPFPTKDGYICADCDSNKLAFYSTHKLEGSGTDFKVRSMFISLYHRPTDKSARITAEKKVAQTAPASMHCCYLSTGFITQ